MKKAGAFFAASTALLFLVIWFHLSWGLGELPSESARSFVLQQLRAPRLTIGFVVGATLALVGAAFQTLFQNPLATPSTVGTTAGATLGALVALVFGLSGAGSLPAVSLMAFIGAVTASFLVLAVASNARARVEEILLAGIAITLAAGAISQGIHAVADEKSLFAAAQWSLGQLPQIGFDKVLMMSVPAAISAGAIFSQRRGLIALSLGDDWARSVGVETRRVRMIVLLGGCLGVATAVSLCGPIAFVGLLVPHVVRLTLNHNKSSFLLLSWYCGGVFLAFCDGLTPWIFPGRELPVGVLTASLGAPALFLLILRGRPVAGGSKTSS